jgi:hypothetical protein
MAGRFKRTKDVGHQSGSTNNRSGGGRAPNMTATSSSSTGYSASAARQRAEEAETRQRADEELDSAYGFARLTQSTPSNSKPAYLFNMRQSSMKDVETQRELSCLDMYFVQESGDTFRAAHLFAPYFLIRVQGNTTQYGEVEQYLMYKYPDEIVKCVEYMREDLEMVSEGDHAAASSGDRVLRGIQVRV